MSMISKMGGGVALTIMGMTLVASADESSAPDKAKLEVGKILQGVRHVMFVGDSLTDASAWTDWVIETLKANGYPDLIGLDAAVAGNRVGMLKDRYEKDVLSLKPDLVVLMIGTNDSKPVEEYRADLELMVRTTRQSGARLILCASPLVRNEQKDKQIDGYRAVVRELASQYGCLFVDFHPAFLNAQKAGQEVLGPDGVHHKIDGWRTLGRTLLDAVGCQAPMIEKVVLYPNVLTDWVISVPVLWKGGTNYPPLPEKPGDGWHKFDRAAEIEKTSWWQKSWMERGGIMPMGQEVSTLGPGCASPDHGAFGLTIVKSDKAVETTMRVGGSPNYVVWLNGECVWINKGNHGYHADSDRFPVKLHKGENQIIVFSNWLFYVSLGDY